MESKSDDRPTITPAMVLKDIADVATALAGVSRRLLAVEEEHRAVLDVLEMHKTAILKLEAAIKTAARPSGAPPALN
ncbi:MAG: hypothetical protein ACE141_14405 [Bryobacteraceae bacterium]